MRDPEGRTYDSASGFYRDDIVELHSGTIAKGSKARGTVVIDVPKGPLTLEYTLGWGGPPATWSIP